MTPITRLRATRTHACAALAAASPRSAQGMGRVDVALPVRPCARRVTGGDVMGIMFRASRPNADPRRAGDGIPDRLVQIETLIATGGNAREIAILDGKTRTAALAGPGPFARSRMGDPRSVDDTGMTLHEVRSPHDGRSRRREPVPGFRVRPLRHADQRRAISSP